MIFLALDDNPVAGARTYSVLPEYSAGSAFKALSAGSAVALNARKGIYIIDAPDCLCNYSMMIFSRNIITPCLYSTDIPGSGSIGSVAGRVVVCSGSVSG